MTCIPGKPTIWTASMDNQLRTMWRYNSCQQIADALGLTLCRIWARAGKLNLPKKTSRKFREPERQAWIEAAKLAADACDVSHLEILRGERRYPVARARWHAFKIVLDSDPRVSIVGLGRIAGYDHTAIMYGLKRLSGASRSEVTGSSATGRKPGTRPLMEAAE